MWKVINHYEKEGYLDIVVLPLSGDQPIAPMFENLYLRTNKYILTRHEATAQSDCFYR